MDYSFEDYCVVLFFVDVGLYLSIVMDVARFLSKKFNQIPGTSSFEELIGAWAEDIKHLSA